jgi:hypothetical protein
MRKILAILVLALFVAPASAQNYNATAGSGLTFGAKLVSSVLYPQWVLCDPATPANCGKVQAGNAAATNDLAVTVADPNGLSALNTLNTTAQAPIPVIAGTLPSTQTPVTTGSTTKAQTDLNGNLYANPVSQYPAGATPITASATGTTGATTATLTGTSTTTVYICGYSIRANATAAATVTNTITGVITATLSSIMWVAPLASGIGVDEQIFNPCIPASGTNQGIAIVSGAPGSGGTVSSKGWGYYK